VLYVGLADDADQELTGATPSQGGKMSDGTSKQKTDQERRTYGKG
jgi:hypothetical protein